MPGLARPLKPGESFDESCGDLLFHSEHKGFDIDALLSRNVSSRTFSFYYPSTRPGSDRWLVVSSDKRKLSRLGGASPEDYEASKKDLIETTLDCLERYVPDIRAKLDHVEAATPKTFEHCHRHLGRGVLRDQVRRAAGQSRFASANFRSVSRW
ncbi:MAG: hypothetical protein U0936_14695 [Planctomycetaceae bacterium]